MLSVGIGLALTALGPARSSGGSPVRTNLVLELIADNIAGADGANFHPWPDTSGNGNNVDNNNEETAPVLKTSILNGHKVVRFSTNQFLSALSSLVPSGAVIFLVASITSGTATNQTLCAEDSMASRGFALRGGQWETNGGTVEAFTLGSGFHVIKVVCGTSISIDSIEKTDAADLPGHTGVFNLGRREYEGVEQYLNGDIAEVLVYTALAEPNRSTVETYLLEKYDIAVPPLNTHAAIVEDGVLFGATNCTRGSNQNGKAHYTYSGAFNIDISWSGSLWTVAYSDEFSGYQWTSTEDTEFPWEVTGGWTPSGTSENLTVTEGT